MSAGSGEKKNSLHDLAEDYVASLVDRARDIERLWQKYLEGDNTDAVLDELILKCHRFSGSAASYELLELSSIGVKMEKLARELQQAKSPAEEKHSRQLIDLSRKLVKLAAGVNLDAVLPVLQKHATELPAKQGNALLYIVDDDQHQSERLALQLASHGFETRSFTELSNLRETLITDPPDAIVADIMFPEGDLAGIEMVTSLREAGKHPVPVVFVSGRKDAQTRLQALRAGGSGYFPKPVNLSALAARLHELTRGSKKQAWRVMIVDDDVTSSMLHAAMLKKEGFDVKVLNHPMKIIDEAMEFKPELIFMDLYMPDANGLEVAGMLRQEEIFLDVPVVFLSGESDESIKEKAVEDGAVLFLSKPVSAEQLRLVASAQSRLYRQRATRNRYLRRIDADTGLYSRDYLLSLVPRFHRLAEQRKGRMAALLMVEIDNYGYLLRTQGEDYLRLLNARVAKLLKDALGKNDVAGINAHGSFMVLTLRTGVDKLERFATALQRRIADEPVDILGDEKRIVLSIGVARVMDDDRNRLLLDASIACSMARKDGGNKVVLHSELEKEGERQQQDRHLRKQLKNALKNRRMFLDYSPIIGLAVESCERFSVLMRLREEDGKVMYPAQFLSLAQQYDLLPVLDRWVLKTAVPVLARRQNAGKKTQFMIKLFPATLHDADFLSWLETLLKKHPLDESTLVMGMMEAEMLGRLSRVKKFVQKLREQNCQILIEHFGQGEDSLQLLDEVKPEYLRLAPSLLENLAESPGLQEQVENLCGEASARDCRVLAPYMHGSETLALLWRLGVDFMQGDILEEASYVEAVEVAEGEVS